MKQVITTEKIPIKLWLDDIEEGALQQAKDLANLPFAYKHIPIMADAHQGYGMPIGGVLPAKRAIVPHAVGSDISCGMAATPTKLSTQDLPKQTLKNIMSEIRDRIPVGRSHHDQRQDEAWMPDIEIDEDQYPKSSEQYESALKQIGTLGGGNHFIEIQSDEDDKVWIMVHSGSRNIGFQVAKYYHNLAKELCSKWYSQVPEDLSFFPLDTKHFDFYYREMQYCIEFARKNRQKMTHEVLQAIRDELGSDSFDFGATINKPHNYADWENHFDENLIIHRKGVARAREGELSMIPGSQGAPSFIVKGKGSPASFHSCSHGAGRVMSRTQAKRTLSVQQESDKCAQFDTIHSIRSESDLDEAPGSYKDITKVMDNQTDLVEIEHTLTPMATIKG